MRTRFAIILTAVLFFLAPQVGFSSLPPLDKIYWTSGFHLYRANMDGTQREPVLLLPTNWAVVDADTVFGKLYLGDFSTHTIRRYEFDGTNEQVVVPDGAGVPIGLAVDVTTNSMYWSSATSDFKIYRSSMDGPSASTLIMDNNPVRGMRVNQLTQKLYWINNSNSIKQANTNGSSVQVLLQFRSFDRINGLDIDPVAGKIYWGNEFTQHLHRANLDGTNIEQLGFSSQPGDVRLDLVEHKLYWSDWQSNTIRRSNLDGTGIETVITSTDTQGPMGLTIVHVPEPGSILLLMLAGAVVMRRRPFAR